MERTTSPGRRPFVDTRLEAFLAVQPKLSRLYREILAEIDKASPDGLAAFEVSERVAKKHNKPTSHRQDMAPRCTELAEMGFLRTTGKPRTNPASGRLNDVYVRP